MSAQQTYEPFDPVFARNLLEQAVMPLNRFYFRAHILGMERLPEQGPAILASNHSGNCLPYDAVVLNSLLWAHYGYRPEKQFRTVFEVALTARWWMRLFGVDNIWRRCGGVDMTFDNFERLLARGDRVLYFPEGVPGIGKGFQRRYKLQRFHTSYLLLAARHGVPVYPVHMVNGEWVMPFHFTIPLLDRVFQKLWSVPFFPLPAGLLAIVFPFLWYLALPANILTVVGEPFDVRPILQAEGITDYDKPDRAKLAFAAEKVRQMMQAQLDELVQLHGAKPYRFGDLFRHLRRAGRHLWRVIPTGWPVSFLRVQRDEHRQPVHNRLLRWLRDWDLLFFYVPLGWPFLTLTRHLRKPPYGYRGLTTQERREQGGDFVWRLSERPLPTREEEFGVSSPAAPFAQGAPIAGRTG